MSKESEKKAENIESKDDVENLYNQMNLISEKKENQLSKEYKGFIIIRKINYSIIIIGFLFFFIVFLFNTFYLIIILMTLIIYIIYAAFLELKYKKIKLRLDRFLINQREQRISSNRMKKFHIYIYLVISSIILSSLVIFLIRINLILLIIIFAVSVIYNIPQ